MQSRIQKPTSQNVSLPIGGKLKCGILAKSASGAMYPKAVNYFRPHCPNNPVYEQYFNEVYGEKPNKLNIVFTANDEYACTEYLELLNNQGKKLSWGDGLNFYVMFNGKEYYLPQEKILEKYGDYDTFYAKMVEMAGKNKKGEPMEWRHALRLRFVLTEIKNAIFAWELNTYGSKSSINNIVSAFDFVKTVTQGKMQMVSFTLSVQLAKSHKAGVANEYAVINLVPNAGNANLLAISKYAGNLLSLGELTNEKIQTLMLSQGEPTQVQEETKDVDYETLGESK